MYNTIKAVIKPMLRKKIPVKIKPVTFSIALRMKSVVKSKWIQ